MKKLLSILCVFSLILGIGSFNLSASADTSESKAMNFVQLRRAEIYENDGKKGVRLYKESNGQYDMFVAKTDCELKANTKYLISMYYKSAVSVLRPSIALMDNNDLEGWNDSGAFLGNYLASMPVEAYSDWRRISFTVDTTGKTDENYKYLSFAAKAGDGVDKVDYAICDITVDEIDDSFEFSFPEISKHFGYIDDGERQYADYTCPNTSYVGISFGAKIHAEPATEYMLMFDYKKSGSFNGAAQFTIDGTRVAEFGAADTAEWKTYSVRIQTPSVITKQELNFNASTLEGKCSFSFDNFRLVPLNGDNIYPSYLKDMSFYQTETNEYGWKFDTEGDMYITTGFVTEYALEANSKYLVTLDYKQPASGWNRPVYFGCGNDSATPEGFVSMEGRALSNIAWSQTNDWVSLTAVIDTGSAVDTENKYFGIWGQTGESKPQFAFKNLKIQKMSSNYIYPTFLRDMKWSYESNGDIAWEFSSAGSQYIVTGYTTNYELKPNSTYAVSFDYKQKNSNWNNGLKFGAASNTTNWEGNEAVSSHPLGYLNISNESNWKNKTVIFKTGLTVDGTNKYLGVWGQTAEGKPQFAFKNLTVTELENSQVMPNGENQFTYSFDSEGKIVWNFSKTSGAEEYSTLAFSTDIELEKDKGYVAVFDYKYATEGWLNNGIEIAALGSVATAEPGKGRTLLNDGNYAGDEWRTLKSAYIAKDVTGSNKYLGFVGKTAPGKTYDISIKNIRLYDLGDVDFDGKIDAADLAELKKDLLGINGTAQFTDVNNDGKTDILDLISLKKISAK